MPMWLGCPTEIDIVRRWYLTCTVPAWVASVQLVRCILKVSSSCYERARLRSNQIELERADVLRPDWHWCKPSLPFAGSLSASDVPTTQRPNSGTKLSYIYLAPASLLSSTSPFGQPLALLCPSSLHPPPIHPYGTVHAPSPTNHRLP